MQTDVCYYENPNYRLIEYIQRRDRDLSLIMCGIEQCLPGKKAGSAKRRGYHLHAVIAGKGKVFNAGHETEVHAGQLFLTSPGKDILYQADSLEPWFYCWVTYDGSKAGSYFSSAGFEDDVIIQDCHIDVNRFLTVSQEMLKKPQLNYASEIFRASFALQFLALAVESYENQNGKTGSYKQLSTDDYIDYAIRYINNNYANVKINDVANYVNLNRTYFASLFRKKMYMSPQEYLMKIRMERSCELLTKTTLPVRIIAGSVGYENPLTFSKIFKRKYGIGPKEYRKGYQTE